MDYQGSAIRDIVAYPVDDHVVSVHVASGTHIIPRVDDGEVALPCIPECQHRHIIRTPDNVVVVKVKVSMTVYPRILSLSQVEEVARETLLEALEIDNVTPTPAAYAEGLRAMTRRIAQQMKQRGVEIV